MGILPPPRIGPEQQQQTFIKCPAETSANVPHVESLENISSLALREVTQPLQLPQTLRRKRRRRRSREEPIRCHICTEMRNCTDTMVLLRVVPLKVELTVIRTGQELI
ncbi:hypothetical protein ATANTOWER_027487 [Ataeniobius toweri]|uniref:Uncharacterized protein n=1 Tax=Ataeniobius toweri TaxID=208326 RepID=A0ABU7B9C7_9TELE|nr:hypothetical protein [Ataeniobius toweri]